MRTYDKWVLNNSNRLDDKTIIVTGATGTLGYYIAYYSLLLGAKVVLAVRNVSSGEKVKVKLQGFFPNSMIEVKYLDLNKLDTINPFVESVKQFNPYILVNNAGVYHLDNEINDQGIEKTFCTNYVGPFMLSEALVPTLSKNNGKIVNQVSVTVNWYKDINYDDFDGRNCKSKNKRYGLSKILMTYYALSLKEAGFNADIAHPGATATTLFSSAKGGFSKAFERAIIPLMRMIFISPSKAVLSDIYAMTHDLKYGEWVGPRGAFHIFGYPKVYKLKKHLLDKGKHLEASRKTSSLINKGDIIK